MISAGNGRGRSVLKFDGDEMNLHVPQDIEAEVEIMVNARCANHIVSSQSNGPVNGIVQDGLVASYMLTRHWDDGTITMVPSKFALQIYEETGIPVEKVKDLIFRAKEYYPEYIQVNPETHSPEFAESIPGSLYMSILFPPNLCYSRTIDNENEKYTEVEIEDGILKSDSAHLCVRTVGAKNNSIVHVLWKRSPEMALKFLSDLQQITDRWLPIHGFSMGIADCFASSSKDVAKILLESRLKVDQLIANNPDKNKDKLESQIMGALNSAMAVGPSLAKGSMMKGDFNALNIMRNSGAKGSVVNLAQIVAFVGQQSIKGARMPKQLSHNSRCLPSFLPGDDSPEARGFVEHNYIQGLTPQEAFFHAAAGRDGVISTALKSVTGETPIVIIDTNGRSKTVLIGDWIDSLLEDLTDIVQKIDEREMELLDVEVLNMKIPTTDEKGNVSWGLIKNVTRHDPGKELYQIKTQSGRDVTVTESKSLLIWNAEVQEFLRTDSSLVKVGDYVPTTVTLKTPIVIPNDTFNLDSFNGLFIGIFLAIGQANVETGEIMFAPISSVLSGFINRWFLSNKVTDIEIDEDNLCISGLSIDAAKVMMSMTGKSLKTRHVPDESFTGPLCFAKSIIQGFAASNGQINGYVKKFGSLSKMIIVGMNMLLSRFGILGLLKEAADFFILEIQSDWLELFSVVILDNEPKNCVSSTLTYAKQNDVVLDKIVSIEKIEIADYIKQYPEYKGKVYDLTIPSTLNFGLANGLHVVDTADTGYVQKRLARKMEDSKVWADGTIRDAKGNIISFLYGDDGLESKKLVAVKGMSVPFFINPIILSKQLNSDAKRSGEITFGIDFPRKLSSDEIEFLLTYIKLGSVQSPVIELATKNVRENLKKAMQPVEIYECKISDLFVNIRNAYDSSKAPYGYAAGLVSTSSIGEPNSQMTLNVFHHTGIGGGKDASVGVPRFKELVNATKTPRQKHAGCTIYFTDTVLLKNAATVTNLEKDNKNPDLSQDIKNNNSLFIKMAKQSSLAIVQSRKNEFEETCVAQFLNDCELKYLPSNAYEGYCNNTPTELLTYEEYTEDWWVSLSKGLKDGALDNEPISWVIILHFNVEKLFSARMELEDIAFTLEDSSNGALTCVVSPNIIGRIEVYVDIPKLKSHIKLKMNIGIPPEDGVKLMTKANEDYFIMRDPVIDFIKKTHISGVKGVEQTYTRENLDTHEWIMDTDGANFLDVLCMPNVDTTRTTTNNMHEVLEVLGIEAARRFLYNDLLRVISFDGTYINPRHISILADIMTCKGDLTAASRDGIARDDAGPNAKIMFEKSVDNAMIACAFGEVDDMASLASSVMYGKVAKTGPGVVEICTKNTGMNINRQPPLKQKVQKVEKSKTVNKTASKTLSVAKALKIKT